MQTTLSREPSVSTSSSPFAGDMRPDGVIRHDWTREEIAALIALPFPELIFRAQSVHRQFFDPTHIQVSSLLSIKTGGCPEDCAYCPQSCRQEEKIRAEKLMEVERVLSEARAAKDSGAQRFCLGAAWRSPKEHDLETVCQMVDGIKAMGLETCATLGMLSAEQARRLKDAGLDYYNHNLDTSAEYYEKIITTRTYQDRLDTLAFVREAGLKICCGGIIGMGESDNDRAGLIANLASLSEHPESVPINLLIKVAGTPLADAKEVDPVTFARIVAAARIAMPRSFIRLAAGRELLSDEAHALIFLAGANSIFWGSKLLTTPNPEEDRDRKLLDHLGLKAGA